MTGTKKCLYSYKNNMKRYKIEHLTSRNEKSMGRFMFHLVWFQKQVARIISRKLFSKISTDTSFVPYTKSREVEATSTGMTNPNFFNNEKMKWS